MARIANCIFVVCLFASTPAAAESPQSPPDQVPAADATEQPDSLRSSVHPTSSKECMYEGAQFTIGAAKCISDQLWLVCQAPDSNHPAAWWNSAQQPLCKGRANTTSAGVATDKKPLQQVGPPIVGPPIVAARRAPCCPLQPPAAAKTTP